MLSGHGRPHRVGLGKGGTCLLEFEKYDVIRCAYTKPL